MKRSAQRFSLLILSVKDFEERRRRLEFAYRVLTEPDLRARYDVDKVEITYPDLLIDTYDLVQDTTLNQDKTSQTVKHEKRLTHTGKRLSASEAAQKVYEQLGLKSF